MSNRKPDSMKVFTGQKLFNGEKVIQDFCLVTEGNKIAYCGPREGAPAFPREEAEDIGNQVIIPGLIDCHVHISEASRAHLSGADPMVERTALAVHNLRRLQEQGVVCVRDAGTPGDIAFVLRQLVSDGAIPGPMMKIAGPALSVTGGHGFQSSIECDGPAEFAKAARRLISREVDWIKVMVTATGNAKGAESCVWEVERDELEAVVREAHKKGVPVFIHAQGRGGVRLGIDCGVDCIEHGLFADRELLEEMKKKGVWYDPTLTPPHTGERKMREDGIEGPLLPGILDENGENRHDNAVRLADEMGLNIVTGTDSGVGGSEDYKYAYKELHFMGEIGLNPLHILTYATRNGAELLGVSDCLGTLETGKNASFILFEGDPTADIDQVYSMRRVYKDGELVFKGGQAGMR